VENAKKPGDSSTPVAPAQNTDGPTVMVPLKDLMAGAKSSATPPVDEEGATTTIDLKQVLGADLEKARAEILAKLDRGGAAKSAPVPDAVAEQPDLVSQKTLQSEPIPALPEPAPQAAPPVPEQSPQAAYSGDATIVSADLARPQAPAPPVTPAPVDAGDATVVDMMIPSAPAAAAPSAPTADVDATVIGAALPPPPKPAAPPKAAPAAGGFWGNAAPGGSGAKAPAPKPAASSGASAAAVPPNPTAPPPAPPAPKAAAPVPPPPAAAKPAPPPAPAAAPVQVPAPVPAAAATVSPQPDAAASGGSRAVRLIVWLVIIIGAIAAGAYFMLKDYQFEETAVVNVTPAPVAEEPVAAPPPTVPPLAEFSGGLTSTTPAILAQQVADVPAEPQVAPTATSTATPAPRPVRRQTAPASRAAVREVAPEEPAAPQEQTPPPPPPAAEGDLVHIDQPGVTPPRLTTDEPARYPVRARMAGAKGTVTLSLLIDQQGRVAEATVARSAGNDLLDNSAILAAKKSVYSPAMKDGVRVRVWISRDYTFQP
jgi:TonB family protein